MRFRGYVFAGNAPIRATVFAAFYPSTPKRWHAARKRHSCPLQCVCDVNDASVFKSLCFRCSYFLIRLRVQMFSLRRDNVFKCLRRFDNKRRAFLIVLVCTVGGNVSDWKYLISNAERKNKKSRERISVERASGNDVDQQTLTQWEVSEIASPL